ncbi:unnamed protein product [Spirodela intermedia]|uniref:GATA transcription factor n=1 Tax=Spirodela intermedia TaxID=51605 RepID=A0A7I8KK29_SPIIN|nr:unnamed protein product [Spirodela intermedia]
MDAPEHLHGSHCRSGNPQFAMEKQGKASDHFAVDDLLNFSNDDECFGGGDEFSPDTAPVNSADESTVTALDSSSNSSGNEQHFSGDCRSADACLSDGLCVPYDELAELEWLSNFVEESFSSEDLQKHQLISGLKSSSSSSALLRQEAHILGKARTKRRRPGPTCWSSSLLVISAANSSSDSAAAGEPAKKKASQGPGAAASGATGDGRKCLHCDTDKTPQWRAGPMGPKTLCNACGVRYKSGRLVPEYRPAASPTFSLSEHSNSHRKVLELRRQKEQQSLPPPGNLHEALISGAPSHAGKCH